MNITIEGKTYAGEATAMEQKLAVLIEANISDGFSWDKQMTILAGNTEYTVSGLRMLAQTGVLLRVEWELDSDLAALEKQLEKAEKEIAERDSMLDRIRAAIEDLGTMPTLTKMLTFLAAVKEAIHYGHSADT